jgi:hypothetical protein
MTGTGGRQGAEGRAARRFGHGQLTLGPRGRVAVTVVVLVVVANLVGSLLVNARGEDPRPAAMVVFLMGVFLPLCGLTLWRVWRPSAEWRLARQEAARVPQREREELERALRGPAVNPALGGPPPGFSGRDDGEPIKHP